MYGAIKAAMFRMDPERAHSLAMVLLRRAHEGGIARRLVRAQVPDRRLAVNVLGIDFITPLGMAAGFDKEAEAYNALLAMGFGHVEVGTVTPRAQAGNPRPRIRRVVEEQALVNSMGFPGPGFKVIQERLAKRGAIGPIGMNIGPNKDASRKVSLDRMRRMAAEAKADYVALNVSSPNTPGLRELQEPAALAGLVGGLRGAMDDMRNRAPLLVKLHPDASKDELVAVAKSAVDAGADGLIAVNTTSRDPAGFKRPMAGGISGAPLRKRALSHIKTLSNAVDCPLIGVGGIFTGQDAFDMMDAGASLVQGYTGFIYRGPRYAELVNQELLAAMDAAELERPPGHYA